MKKTLKKGFTIAVSVMTITWSIGIAAFAPLSAAAAPSAAAVSAGDLVKASLAAVYYVGNDGKRYVFPNQKTYNTWYSDFSSVKTITDAELAAIAIGGNVTYRPGAALVKITTDPKVYMVGANAQLHALANEATAIELYGSNWASMVDDVPDAFFTNYTVASGEVNVAALGAGGTPIGTIGMMGSDYYTTSQDGHHMLTGVNSSVVRSVVMIDDMSELEAWFGVNDAGAAGFDAISTPDRMGILEGGSGTPPPTTGADWNVRLVSGDNSANASNGTVFTLGMAEVEICYNGSGSVTVTAWNFDSGRGTVSFNSNATVHISGEDFFAKLTSSDDTRGVAEVIEGNGLTFGNGECHMVDIFGGTTSTSGIFILDLMGMTVDGSEVVLPAAMELMNRAAVTILSSDIAVITFSSAVGPGTVEPGEQVRLFQYQLQISGNEANIPYLVFDTSGTLDVTNCYATRNGVIITGDWMWVGSFMVFMVNESDQFFNDQSYTIELWCDVWGQAGQTIGIDVEYPAPFFKFLDAQRNVFVAPTVSTLTLSISFTINGSSATVTNVNLATSVSGLNQSSGSGDQVSSGTSNATMAVFLVEIRGSRATLNSLTYQMIQGQTGTAEGLTNCEVYVANLPGAAEIDESNVDLNAMSRSQVGSLGSPNAANVVTITFSKILNTGDYVIIVECDATPSSGADTAYEANDVIGTTLVAGANNISFDIGGSQNFPTANVQGTLVTVVLLSGISVQADTTTQNVVSNASNKPMGNYVILGPSTEDVLITSVTAQFAAGVNNGSCTTVRARTLDGENQSQTQALNGGGALQTLTFSMNFTVESNGERTLVFECTQAGTVVVAVVANATTLTAISGSGADSGQSLNFTVATPGGSVNFAAAVAITVSQSTLPPQQFLGQQETLTGNKVSVQLTNAEGASLTNITATITQNSAAALQNFRTVTFFIEGATVAGTYASAATELCSRTVTNTTPNCTFNPGDVTVQSGSNAVITAEVTGPSSGDTNQPDPTNDTLTLDIVNTTGVTMKGLDSGITVNDAAGATTFTGRVLTPLDGQLRAVAKATGAASILPGQTDMPIGNFDLIVGSGSNVVLNALGGFCNTNDTTNVCTDGSNIDLVIDGTVQATTTLANNPATDFAFTGQTLLMTSGTHDYELRVDATGCSTNDNIQLTMDQYDFTINGVAYTTLAARLADLNTFASNNMTFESNLCG